jgi:hypothetical protein
MLPGWKGDLGSPSKMQSLIDEIIAGLHEQDRQYGNPAGLEVIETMVRFFRRPPPPESFPNLREFLDYRHEDAGVQ